MTTLRIWLTIFSIPVLLGGCQQEPENVPASSSPIVRSGSVARSGSNESGSAESNSTGATDSPDDGAVELKFLDFDGIEQLIASHRGRVVVMDAWSTSCAPCLKEFPHLVELHAKYGSGRLACISLSFDYEGGGTTPQQQAPRVTKFLVSQKATFDNVLSTEDSDTLYRKFGLASIPAVFVYDKAGRLRKRFDNQHAQREADVFTYQQVGELAAQLLAEDAPAEDDEPRE